MWWLGRSTAHALSLSLACCLALPRTKNRDGRIVCSCKEVKAQDASAQTGTHTIKDADGKDFIVWCNMDADGGGWTLIACTRPRSQPSKPASARLSVTLSSSPSRLPAHLTFSPADAGTIHGSKRATLDRVGQYSSTSHYQLLFDSFGSYNPNAPKNHVAFSRMHDTRLRHVSLPRHVVLVYLVPIALPPSQPTPSAHARSRLSASIRVCTKRARSKFTPDLRLGRLSKTAAGCLRCAPVRPRQARASKFVPAPLARLVSVS